MIVQNEITHLFYLYHPIASCYAILFFKLLKISILFFIMFITFVFCSYAPVLLVKNDYIYLT